MDVMQTFLRVIEQVPYFAAIFILLIVSKYFYQYTTSYNIDEELTDKDNPAFGIGLAMYLLGTTIALTGLLFGVEGDLKGDFVTIFVYGLVILLLMRSGIFISDKLILSKFSIHKEICDDMNSGTGFVVGSLSVGTGIIIKAAMTGYSNSFGSGIRDLVICFVIGQCLFLAASYIYQKITSYDMHSEIEDDNVAVGISFSGFILGISIISYSAIVGSIVSIEMFITSLLIFAVGFLLLIAGRIITDRLLINRSMSDEIQNDRNLAVAFVEASISVSLALALATVLS